MVHALLLARAAGRHAESAAELVWDGWWEARGWAAPPAAPKSAMLAVLIDLFGDGDDGDGGGGGSDDGRDGGGGSDGGSGGDSGGGPEHVGVVPSSAEGARGSHQGNSGSCGKAAPAAAAASAGASFARPGERYRRYDRSAPSGSLLSRLALHALVFGNARAVCDLWQREGPPSRDRDQWPAEPGTNSTWSWCVRRFGYEEGRRGGRGKRRCVVAPRLSDSQSLVEKGWGGAGVPSELRALCPIGWLSLASACRLCRMHAVFGARMQIWALPCNVWHCMQCLAPACAVWHCMHCLALHADFGTACSV
eukprot:365794-Chlamydomonas_euryale.AAC.6